MKRDINSYFDGVLKNIDTARDIVSNWYKAYIKSNTLIGIEPKN